MKLKIEIEMDNAAFEDGNGREAARILRDLADNIEPWQLAAGEANPSLRDANGNKVGTAKVTQ
jgi:hypothetical protein